MWNQTRGKKNMQPNKVTCAICKGLIQTLALHCWADTNKIIDLLAEYLWTEEEVLEIKNANPYNMSTSVEYMKEIEYKNTSK